MKKRHQGARTLEQVLEQSPSLSQLKARLQDAQSCLKAITPLIPTPMRKAVHAGPIETQTLPSSRGLRYEQEDPSRSHTYWVVLVDNTAVAAKLRQLQPLMLQYLEKTGFGIQEVRVQILPPNKVM